MKFCLECGEGLEFLGLSEWSTGIWLYGCKQCDILWERHGCSISGSTTGYEKSFQKLSELEKYKQNK
ncbi:MAG: hypothetical protein Q8R29_02180 [bacterium]|nr:hypothetical protein [bacterium]